ncbi:FRG domain-containing protein [Listeria weihenstephanensis]|uniref:FRG domain-containing protein n=1 Tax=Listeria weihenstephanensis TaxID=1006155 RepID=A0A841Z8N7_9LIST|nr:FRG domain-containing protein [Listeria weihenstephanensis]MBC1500992.1 FRG domain-containing protein [Listeria weihenstephanensis]
MHWINELRKVGVAMIEVHSLKDFNKAIQTYAKKNGTMFRGQGANYPSITASLARDQGYLENESCLYKEVMDLKKDEFIELITDIQRLAKLQHYGVPTRLIDVTSDGITALFFAVEDVGDDDGYVYIYSQTSHNLNSREVRLLSLLAFLKEYDLLEIRQGYESQFGETISDKEILEIAQQDIFVEYSDVLQSVNPRMYNQKGAFVICGNVVRGDKIQLELKTMDDIVSEGIIKIPSEYKGVLKHELDVYGVNETFIYPELPSVASYVREKYKHKNFSSDGTYTILDEHDVSTASAKRISFSIILNHPLGINEIKSVAKELLSRYQKNYEVVWVYIAKNSEDYIMVNWILIGQWIDESLLEKPRAISQMDDEGYHWKYTDDYSVLGDYYSDNHFEENELLFEKYQEKYKQVLPIYVDLIEAFENKEFDSFKRRCSIQKSEINQIFSEIGDFGHSKNPDLDKFFHKYVELFSLLGNIPLYAEYEDTNQVAWEYMINECFQDVKLIIEQIELTIIAQRNFY